ncbi:DUF2937 family protein [Rhizobium lentis]|uniref:Uncharacterized membrane protein YuzA (DUF378 family) n=1 Tax=Rhizobium lentis TaxID=1138194 RepID=A0A7W8XFY6_9HYPH|nr:DUF2937 family protein [Rhizobium lentis]MBB4575048.1 uncharacterized membrane protein YuzA (DUF378 family) [Rhizobium lentis]MBB5551357.1 uncharacterized membrane protein YuzA (DUF378 family) [Rhizobium lentis]MBB5562147.1 uncharacterized membrane protein YuzA (DUF378 family) [Rhizobium lentis]MBB5568730.1 uncharacterized membrane protein YuzA (DUF378 family) [Rhizobium lentis]
MGPIARIIAIVAGLAGGTVLSQAPEFAQQYRQRIGGAIDELRVIVEDFNRQATEHHLNRQQALKTYAQSSDDFLRDRGASMQSTIARYETLLSQQLKLGAAAPVTKPFVLIGEPDDVVFANTLRDFVPGVPVSFAGLVWAAIGFISAWVIAALLGFSVRRVVRGRRTSPHAH